MFPYKDDNPSETFPFVTVALIAINTIIFIGQMGVGLQASVQAFGALPASLFTMDRFQPIHPSLTVITSMFMHGGIMHLAGNMLYLWIFGDNIEDRLGHFKFLLFYILGGVFAVYAHAITAPESVVPMVGASGAIAAILGAYVLMYPRAQVYTLIFLGFFIQTVRLPALIVIGFWAIIQLVSGAASGAQAGQGGTAWFAHLGGFAYGIAVVLIFLRKYVYRRNIKWS
jgi:membrane associated rhomboid family serine protease